MLIKKNDCIFQSDDHFNSEERFYTKGTWFTFSLITPIRPLGALCITLRPVYDTMQYHYSTTQKNVF